MPSLRNRLRRLAEQSLHADPEPAPFAIEQDAPGAPVRFYRNQPFTWGADGGGEVVEMEPEAFLARWPGKRFLRWEDQPWAPSAAEPND